MKNHFRHVPTQRTLCQKGLKRKERFVIRKESITCIPCLYALIKEAKYDADFENEHIHYLKDCIRRNKQELKNLKTALQNRQQDKKARYKEINKLRAQIKKVKAQQ